MDKDIFGRAEYGTYATTSPTPHIDLAGTMPAGYAIEALFVDDLTNGDTVTVTVRKDRNNWVVYSAAVFTTGTPNLIDLSGATLRDSSGTLSNGDTVEVVGIAPLEPAVVDESITTADLSAAVNTRYRLTVSGLTADRYLILPSGAADGDVIEWELVTAAPATYELVLKGDTAVTVTLRGTSTTAAEVTRYFIEGESGRAVFDGTEWRINVSDDGRTPCVAGLKLTTAVTTNTASSYYYPTDNGGAWTAQTNVGGIADESTGTITMRRAGVITINANFGANVFQNSGEGMILCMKNEAEILRCLTSCAAAYISSGSIATSDICAAGDAYRIQAYNSAANKGLAALQTTNQINEVL